MRDAQFEPDMLAGFPAIVDEWTDRVREFVSIGDDTFLVPAPGEVADLQATLNAHYACFIEGLAMAEWLGRNRLAGDVVAGYSMGLFPALCYADALDLEDGLRLMREICVRVHEAVEGHSFAMGAVIGLSEVEVRACLLDPVEITDVYSPSTLILAGPSDRVNQVIEACGGSGALETLLIPVSAPFHSTALQGVTIGNEESMLGVEVRPPSCLVVSATTGELLRTPVDVRDEVCSNVSSPMHWFATLNCLLDLGVKRFFECGRSQRLTNSVRRELVGTYSIEAFLDFAQESS